MDEAELKKGMTSRCCSEGMLKVMQRMAGIGCWRLDLSNDALWWSEELYRIFGIDPDDGALSLERFLERVHPDDREELQKQISLGMPYRSEYRVLASDGSSRFIHEEVEIHKDTNGRPYAYSGIAQDITQRKMTEAEASERKAMVEQIMDTARVGIGFVDRNGVFTHANRHLSKMLGTGLEELRGSAYIDFVHPDERVTARDNMLALIMGKIETADVDRRYIRRDGTSFWGHLTCNRFCDAQGDYIGLIGVISDITERKEIEQNLRETRELMSLFIQHSPIYAFIKEVTPSESRVVQASDNFIDMIGISARDMIGRTMEELFPPEFARKISEDDWKVVSGGGVLKLDEDLNGRNYTTIKFPLVQGERTLLAGYTIDITDRKQAEEKLRQNEQFIRGILDSVDEGFIVVDRDYRILTANKAYCSQVGAACDDVIGKNCYEISHRISRPCYEAGEECAVRQVFADGEPHAVSHKHVDANGNVVYVETKAYPMKDAAGSIVSVIETVSNITEKYLLEEERLKTQKLESIGTLAGGIAHDFNNLLQGVFGYISLAKLNADSRMKSLEALDEAEKALHLTVKLTNQLLTFSKGGKPVMRSVSIRQIVENAVRFALSGSRSVSKLTAAADIWNAEADDGQISQVIQNILLNADQAMPEGGSIDINIRNVTAPDRELPLELKKGDYVEVTIKDTGIGIPQQYLAKIFDPYFTTKEKGSGLGLATSYSIVRNHGGLITVSSVPGEGSTFSIYLPAIRTYAADDPVDISPAETKQARILVMDDEEVVRVIVGELLRALGHDVEFAANGDVALKLYQSARDKGSPFDVVILDLTIRGGMGGEETVKRLLSIDPDVRAIVSSGYSDDEVIANYSSYGFRSYLKKPFRVEQLREVINAVLS